MFVAGEEERDGVTFSPRNFLNKVGIFFTY
jgi:hypothetical protein